MRQESIERGGVPNMAAMLKRGSGGSAFRETFPEARTGSVKWRKAGSGMTLADVLKAMQRKKNIGFSITFHRCLRADILLCGILTVSISTRH